MTLDFHSWVPTPPMGWNSWDCFGTAVNESEVRENADYMAEKLRAFGWEYIVIDIQWFQPTAKSFKYIPNARLTMDSYGRLLPAVNRFPSAEAGHGFKALADYIHSKGLKLGIHVLRGVPRQAVEENCPILGSSAHAADIADQTSTCRWNKDMYGIDTSKTGAQEYYDSIIAMYAEWEIDYIKVDDCSFPYHRGEIEAIRKSINKCGRKIVFSLSPGPTFTKNAAHLAAHANLWRTNADLWDYWSLLRIQFYLCKAWAPYIQPGAWPDADMIPLGYLRVHSPERGKPECRLTKPEQQALMTLFAIFRSPLMFGGHLPKTDDYTLSLLTNTEVLDMHKNSRENQALQTGMGSVIWVASNSASHDKYVALFNLRGRKRVMSLKLKKIGLGGTIRVRELWNRQDLGSMEDNIQVTVDRHGACLLRLSPL